MTRTKPDRAIDAAVAQALQRTPPLPDAVKDRITSALQTPMKHQRPGTSRQEDRRTAGLENL